jgi:hypothetical protein
MLTLILKFRTGNLQERKMEQKKLVTILQGLLNSRY